MIEELKIEEPRTEQPDAGFCELTPMPTQALIEVPKRLGRATTLHNLWQDYVKSRGPLNPATLEHYRHFGKRFVGFMRGKQLTPATIMAWCIYLQTTKVPRGREKIFLGPVRINEINTRIKGFLRFLYKLRYAPDLREIIPTLTTPEPAPGKIITEQEYEAIKSYMAGKEVWQSILWLCILAYRTGMSLVDCCHLRWANVTLSEDGPSFIDIQRIKLSRFGQKGVCRIPVVPGTDIHQWLLRLREVENYKRKDGINDYVHQDAPGEYVAFQARIRDRIKYLFNGDPRRKGPLKKGLAPGRSFKHFRNSLCSNLVNSGAQLALVCKITGHQNVKTLLGYLNVDREALEDAMQKAYEYAEQKSGTNSSHDGLAKEEDV